MILVGLVVGFYPLCDQTDGPIVFDPNDSPLLEGIHQAIGFGDSQVQYKKTMFIWPLACWVNANGEQEWALGLDDFLLQFIPIEGVLFIGAEFTFGVVRSDNDSAVGIVFLKKLIGVVRDGGGAK